MLDALDHSFIFYFLEDKSIKKPTKESKTGLRVCEKWSRSVNRLTLASNLKGQPNEVRRIINEIASENDLGEIEVSFDSDKMFSTFTVDDIDQIIVFINQVNGKIGLNIRSLDYENSNKAASVTVEFEMVN